MTDRADTEAARAALFERLLERHGLGRRETIPRRQATSAPLSFGQRPLWLFQRLQPGSACYNSAAAFRVEGRPDAEALERSLLRLMRRHEVLRSVVVGGDDPVLEVAPELASVLATVDLRALGAAAAERAAWDIAKRDATLPFDLERGPLVRAALVRTAETSHLLVVDIHHIAIDAWSLPILLNELSAIYGAEVAGRLAELEPLPIQYGDFAAWQLERVHSGAMASGLAHWTEQLKGALPLELPTDRPRRALRAFRGATERIDIVPALAHAIASFAQRSGTTLFSALLTPFSVLLGAYHGCSDVVVGAPTSGRSAPELDPLIGFFVNMVPLRVDLSGAPSWRELVARATKVTSDALTHQDVPLDIVVDALRLKRRPGRHPLFDVSFALHEFPLELLSLVGCEVRPLPLSLVVSRFDLEVHVVGAATQPEVVFQYDTDLFEASTIRRMAEQYLVLVARMVATPDARASADDALIEEERRRLGARQPEFRTPLGLGTAAEPASDVVEGAIAAIWSEVLDRDDIGRSDDFFDLGGHSLLSTRVAAHIEEIFGVAVPLKTMLEATTVSALARQLVALSGDRGAIEETARIVLEVAASPDDASGPEEGS